MRDGIGVLLFVFPLLEPWTKTGWWVLLGFPLSLSLSLPLSCGWEEARIFRVVSLSANFSLFTPLNRRSRDQRRFHSRMLFMCLRLGLITFASRKSCGIVFVFLLFLLWHHFCQESSKVKLSIDASEQPHEVCLAHQSNFF